MRGGPCATALGALLRVHAVPASAATGLGALHRLLPVQEGGLLFLIAYVLRSFLMPHMYIECKFQHGTAVDSWSSRRSSRAHPPALAPTIQRCRWQCQLPHLNPRPRRILSSFLVGGGTSHGLRLPCGPALRPHHHTGPAVRPGACGTRLALATRRAVQASQGAGRPEGGCSKSACGAWHACSSGPRHSRLHVTVICGTVPVKRSRLLASFQSVPAEGHMHGSIWLHMAPALPTAAPAVQCHASAPWPYRPATPLNPRPRRTFCVFFLSCAAPCWPPQMR